MEQKYQLKRAIIESSKTYDNKSIYGCRIIPDMVDYSTSTDTFPLFPCFLATTSQAYLEQDIVWVVTVDDFQVGYILGLAENILGTSTDSFFTMINSAETTAGFDTSAYGDISITSMLGTCIDFYNRKNNQSGRIFRDGVVIIYSSKGDIYVKNPKFTSTTTYDGDITESGTSLTETYNTKTINITKLIETLGSKETYASGTIKENISGSHQINVVGPETKNIVGGSDTLIAKKKTETIGLGESKRIIAGGSDTTVVVGNITQTAVAGSISMTGTLGISLNSTASLSITTPSTTITGTSFKAITTGLTVSPLTVTPGVGPFCGLPFCLMTGAPHGGCVAGVG